MAESELHRKGNEIRRRLLGDKYVDRVNATTYQDPIMRTFIDVATENVFGALWARPGLDLKTRTLVCVVSDAAPGRGSTSRPAPWCAWSPTPRPAGSPSCGSTCGWRWDRGGPSRS